MKTKLPKPGTYKLLADFDLIDPCGMPGLVSTSIAVEAGRPEEPPSTAAVERVAAIFAMALAARLGADLAGFPADRNGVAPIDPSRAAGR